MSVFFALLALVAAVVGVVALLLSVRQDRRTLVGDLMPLLGPLAWAIAATAMVGSLYYSESQNFTPCLYCWYQRICMYPLVAVIGVGWLRKDEQWGWYALPLSLVGLGLSLYHYQLQMFPDQSSSCDITAPCNAQWVDTFGFVSIPFMAGCGFFAITGLAILSLRCRADSPSPGTNAVQTNSPDVEATL